MSDPRAALLNAKCRMHNIRLEAEEGSLIHALATDALDNIDEALERTRKDAA